MLKIVLEVKENKDKDSCNVKIVNQKDLSKATENEKRVGGVVVNEITKTLENIREK